MFLGFAVVVPLAVVVMPRYDIGDRSFSSYGYEQPVWFVLWGIATAIGVSSSFRAMAQNLASDDQFDADSILPQVRTYFLILNIIACVCVVILSMVYEQGKPTLANHVHLICAQLFGVFLVGSVAGLLILNIGEFQQHFLFLAVMLASVIFSFFFIIVKNDMSAKNEFVGMLPTMIIMMISTLTADKKFKLSHLDNAQCSMHNAQ